MAAVGGNNVYVDIIFRLQAEAAKKAEQLITQLIKRGQLATATLGRFKFPGEFPKSTTEATTQLFKFAQQIDNSARASSRLWRQAIKPLIHQLSIEERILRKQATLYSRAAKLTWDQIRANAKLFNEIKRVGATQDNYRRILRRQAAIYFDIANKYNRWRRDLESGGKLLREELINQRRLHRIYRTTGIQLEGLDQRLIKYARVLDSLLPLSERTWRPSAEQIQMLGKGLSALDRKAAENLMTMARFATVAKATGEPLAYIDETAYRLLKNFDKINFRLAQMGILFPVTTESSLALARGAATVSEEAIAQAKAFAQTVAALDRLGISARGNIALGSQLYDIFTGNTRAALDLEDSVKDATGIFARFSPNLHLVNRALRSLNANFEINYDTLKRIAKEGWAVFTTEQQKALRSIKEQLIYEKEIFKRLKPHERALLDLILAVEEYDKALHFELRTAQDAEFLLRRLKTVGYDRLTKAEKRAIEVARERLALTWDMDERMRRTLKRVIDLRDAYTSQNQIFGRLTARQQMFLIGVNRLRGGLARLSRFIDRVSIGSLKLLGPLFLATAAFNTISRIVGTCIESFSNYENALMDLRVSGGLAVEQVNRMSMAFTALERILPISATEMARIATAAAKAGITGTENLKRFTMAIIKFTQVTGWSAEEASEALLKIARAFEVPIEESEKLASMMHYLAIVSVADADDIVKAMARIGAAAVNLGITADEAAAMATTLIDAGMGAERAGTRLRAFFREFLEKGDKIVEVMQKMGGGFEDFGEIIATDPARALKEFLRFLANIDDEAGRARIVYEIFGSVAGFAVLTLAEHYPLLQERMEAAHQEMIYGTRLTKDFNKWMDATSVSLKRASNAFDRLKRSIGAALSPAVITIAEGLASIVERIFPTARRGITLMTEGTQEWLDIFEAGVPAAEKLAERLLRVPRAAPRRPGITRYWITSLERERKEINERNKLIEEGTYDYINYAETVVTAGDDIFARTGDIINLIKEQGKDVSNLTELENKYYQETERSTEARKLIAKIEEDYGRERIRRIADEIRLTGKATDASEEEIAAAKQLIDLEEFLAEADAERARIKWQLISATRLAAEEMMKEPGITYETYKALNDYVTLVDNYDSYIKKLNKDEAISLALLSKHGPLYRDLAQYIPAGKLADYSKQLEESARSGKSVAPTIKEINDYLDTQGLELVLTAEGWRIATKNVKEHEQAAERVHDDYKKLIEDTESLDKKMRNAAASAAKFFDEFNKGWRLIDNYMDALFGIAEAKTELDRRLRYTAPGIMFRREYGAQIETIEQLIKEYEAAAKAGESDIALKKKQKLMTEMVTFAQQVFNDVMAEQNPILRQQKMGYLDLVRLFYQWVYGVTGELPAATAELDEFAKTALEMPTLAELTAYLNLNTDPATTKLNEWIKENTGKTIEIQITPIMAKEIEEWIKAAPAGGGAPAAQAGGYVLKTGYALIHKGEYIIPRELIEEFRSGARKEEIEVTRQFTVHINNLNVGRAEDFKRFIRELETYYI